MKLGRAAIILLVLFGSIGCDQVTKQTAQHYLEGRGTLSYLGDTFRLTYVINHGAFLGLGSDLPEIARTLIFTGFVSLLMVGLIVWIVRRPDLSKLALIAFTLVLGGGIGNLIDRIMNNGGVIDFMNLGIGPVRTGIFNVADVWIVVGAALLFLAKETREGPPKEVVADLEPGAPPQ